MRISRTRRKSPPPGITFRSAAIWIFYIFAIFGVFTLGFLAKQYGWIDIPMRWTQMLLVNPRSAIAGWRAYTQLPVVKLDIRFTDLQQLTSYWEAALRLGVHIPFEDEVVTAASVLGNGQREAVDIRLPGGPVALISKDAWSFEIHRQDSVDWLKLIPVGYEYASSYWMQFGYLESLRVSGFAAAQLALVRLEVNGSPEGLYVLETPAEVDMDVYFDATALWQAMAAGDPVEQGHFRYASISSTHALPSSGQAALQQMQALTTGESALSEVFEAEEMGRFLALTALWSGHFMPDWRTIRFDYDTATQRFTPVGTAQFWTDHAHLPEAFIGDPAVQVAYAGALAEIVQPDYLLNLRHQVDTNLDTPWTILSTLALDDPWEELELNQRAVRAYLYPENPLSATLEVEGTDYVLKVSNLRPFPIQLIGLDAGGSGLQVIDPAWITEADMGKLIVNGQDTILKANTSAYAKPVHIHLSRPLTAAGGDSLSIVCQLWNVPGPVLYVPVIEQDQLAEDLP